MKTTTQTVRLVTKGQPTPKASHVPGPAKNLGAHLKAPTSGEFVTEHQRPPRSEPA